MYRPLMLIKAVTEPASHTQLPSVPVGGTVGVGDGVGGTCTSGFTD